MIAPFAAVLAVTGLVLVVSLIAFWVWMLVDCLTREPGEGNDRVVWLLAIVLTKLIGAALYYFLRYRRRMGRTAPA